MVRTAVNGGSLETNLAEALTNGLLNTAASESASWIGANTTGLANAVSHAIAGCLVGAGRAAAEAAQAIYRGGLPARGSNTDLADHANNNAPDSAFRGTTTAPVSQAQNAGAAYWAGERGLVVELTNVRGYDVNQALDGRVRTILGFTGSRYFGEQEIAVPGAIPPENISRIGVVFMNSQGRPEVRWIERQ